MNHIDETWIYKVKDEVHILWLNIVMDGLNPPSLQNTNHFFWPMVVINNNIPPWLFVKNEHLMLALIFLGRREVKRMDVYLQPLIYELSNYGKGYRHTMYQDPFQWRGLLHCITYVRT